MRNYNSNTNCNDDLISTLRWEMFLFFCTQVAIYWVFLKKKILSYLQYGIAI